MTLSMVNFTKKNWSKSLNTVIVYNGVVFKCICATTCREQTQLFSKLFTRATENRGSMGKLQFRKFPARPGTKVPKLRRADISYFLLKYISKSSEFYYLELGLYPSITRFFETKNTLNQQRHDCSENCITVKRSRRTRKEKFFSLIWNLDLQFLLRTSVLFGINVGNESEVTSRKK